MDTVSIDLEQVKAFIIEAHGSDKRSDGNLFYNHPISVMNRLNRAGIKCPVVLATALCHDVIEDTKKTYADIEAIAGTEVADSVVLLTNTCPAGTPFVRKQELIVEHSKKFNDVAKRVKLADRYDNLADAIWTWPPWRVKIYAKAGIDMLDTIEPLPQDIQDFAIEARRFFSCLVP